MNILDKLDEFFLNNPCIDNIGSRNCLRNELEKHPEMKNINRIEIYPYIMADDVTFMMSDDVTFMMPDIITYKIFIIFHSKFQDKESYYGRIICNEEDKVWTSCLWKQPDDYPEYMIKSLKRFKKLRKYQRLRCN